MDRSQRKWKRRREREQAQDALFDLSCTRTLADELVRGAAVVTETLDVNVRILDLARRIWGQDGAALPGEVETAMMEFEELARRHRDAWGALTLRLERLAEREDVHAHAFPGLDEHE